MIRRHRGQMGVVRDARPQLAANRAGLSALAQRSAMVSSQNFDRDMQRITRATTPPSVEGEALHVPWGRSIPENHHRHHAERSISFETPRYDVEQQPGTSRGTNFQPRAAPPQPTFRQQSSRRQQPLNESWKRSAERQRPMAPPPRPRQPIDSQPSVSTGQTPPLIGGTAVRARSPCRINVPTMTKEEQIRRVLNVPDMRAIAKRMSDRTMRFAVDNKGKMSYHDYLLAKFTQQMKEKNGDLIEALIAARSGQQEPIEAHKVESVSDALKQSFFLWKSVPRPESPTPQLQRPVRVNPQEENFETQRLKLRKRMQQEAIRERLNMTAAGPLFAMPGTENRARRRLNFGDESKEKEQFVAHPDMEQDKADYSQSFAQPVNLSITPEKVQRPLDRLIVPQFNDDSGSPTTDALRQFFVATPEPNTPPNNISPMRNFVFGDQATTSPSSSPNSEVIELSPIPREDVTNGNWAEQRQQNDIPGTQRTEPIVRLQRVVLKQLDETRKNRHNVPPINESRRMEKAPRPRFFL